MSRQWNADAEDLRITGQYPVTAAPFTVAGWVQVSDHASIRTLFGIGNENAADGWDLITGVSGAATIWFRAHRGGSANAITTTTYTTNTWIHVCGVEGSATDHRAYLNGGGKGTSTTSITPNSGAFSATTFGRRNDAPARYFRGISGCWTVWDAALTDAEVATLAAGIDPRKYRPGNIVYHCPMNGQDPEPDIYGRVVNMGVTGTPDLIDTAAPLFGGHVIAP